MRHIFLLATVLTFGIAEAIPPRYRVIRPQSVGMDTFSCINDAGLIGGRATVGAGDHRAAVWQYGGSTSIAPHIPNIYGYFGVPSPSVYDIAESGYMTGQIYHGTEASQPFRWRSDQNFEVLPILPQITQAPNQILNDGTVLVESGGQNSFYWKNGNYTYDLPNSNLFYTVGLTETGIVHGYRLDGMTGKYFAVFYNDVHGMRDIEQGIYVSSNVSGHSADSSIFSGYSEGVSGVPNPLNRKSLIFWNEVGSKTSEIDLSHIPGYFSSDPMVNNHGETIFSTSKSVPSGSEYLDRLDGYIYSPLAGVVNLNTLIEPGWSEYKITATYDINSRGQIIAQMRRRLYGDIEYVLLDPVPEPATIFALSAGMAGIVARRRKRNC